MTEAAIPTEPEVFVLRSEKGKVYGPCGSCAFFNDKGTKATRTDGRCHGAPPQGGMAFSIVRRGDPGCAAFVAGK